MVGGVMLPSSEALAFGQQWRPAPGAVVNQQRVGMAHMPRTSRFARVPNFRPAVRPTTTVYVRQQPYRPNYRPSRISPPTYAMPARTFPQTRYYAQTRSPMGGWGQPFGGFAQMWQRQMPMFGNRFASGPAPRSWNGAQMPRRTVPSYAGQRFEARAIPPTKRFRPKAGLAMAPPSPRAWRPVQAQQPVLVSRRVAGWASGHVSAPSQSGYRGARSAWKPMPRAAERMVSNQRNAFGGQTLAHWRPQSSVPSRSWRPDDAFRPAGYGRLAAESVPVAARSSIDTGAESAKLPGWATTYESASNATCTWCSGS